jgi:hypothetical protein
MKSIYNIYESILSDIETTMRNGDDFVKGIDNEITNIQKNVVKIKNWITEPRFSQLIETRLFTEFDAKIYWNF